MTQSNFNEKHHVLISDTISSVLGNTSFPPLILYKPRPQCITHQTEATDVSPKVVVAVYKNMKKDPIRDPTNSLKS